MEIRNEALRAVGELPENCSWEDVLQAVAARAGAYGARSESASFTLRELQATYSAEGRATEAPEREPAPAAEGEADMGYRERITIEPGKRSGKPCIRGMRMTVSDVLDYLASGMTEEEILSDFPDLERADIRACLAFAADRERKLFVLPA